MYGDFEWDQAPYMFATSAYWVPLSKLVKNVTRARAMTEIEIFEGNMAELGAPRERGRGALVGGRAPCETIVTKTDPNRNANGVLGPACARSSTLYTQRHTPRLQLVPG